MLLNKIIFKSLVFNLEGRHSERKKMLFEFDGTLFEGTFRFQKHPNIFSAFRY